MNPEIQWACNELISALIEGGAQGALITVLIWGVLKLFPGANAATRHAAWFSTLVVVALLPVAHFGSAVAAKWKASATPAQINLPVTVAAAAAPGYEFAFDESTADETLPSETAIPFTEPETVSQVSAPVPSQPAPTFSWKLAVRPKLALILVILWLLLAAIRLGGIAGQLTSLRSIKLRAIPARDAFVYGFARVVANMGVSRRPRLLLSDHAAAPMVVGFFRPAMLLPNAIAARSSSAQLEHLFRHELAHLARWDDWTNLIQQGIAAVFFFHPGVLFLSRRLTAEREIACDDHALAIGRAPREYALFLTEFASQMKGRDFSAAPAAWSSNSQLKERIGMILNGKRNASPRVSRAGAGAIGVTAVALAIGAALLTPRFVVAAEESAPKASGAGATISVETKVDPTAEVAVNVEPVKVAVPAISVSSAAPSAGVTIASITAPPREKGPLGAANINIDARPTPHIVAVSPAGPKIAMTPSPDGLPDEPRPRKPGPRFERDGDLEKRLDRLEKMVEELMAREKRGPRNPDGMLKFQNNFNADEIRGEIERAQRDAERARRDAERAVREQKMAMEANHRDLANQHDWAAKMGQDMANQQAGRESLKARRHALEAQRKQIEKELEALDKEMQKADELRDKQKQEKQEKLEKLEKLEKRNKEEKLEKKTRDRGGDKDSDDDGKKP